MSAAQRWLLLASAAVFVSTGLAWLHQVVGS